MQSIFITGASGCVGHYVSENLAPDYKLYLLVRNPSKIQLDLDKYKNITVITDDLDNISAHAEILSQVDYLIHIATVWGGEKTETINVHRTHEMFNMLNEDRLKRVIYFSTASILGRDMEVLPEAEKYGTDYIRTKSMCFQQLPETKVGDKVVTVFPTLVFGGDETHPMSHLTRSLPMLKKFGWLIGRLNVDITFHFIHAEDIAKMVRYLLEKPEVEKKYVLGNEQIGFGDFTKRAAKYFNYKIGWQLKLTPQGLYRTAKTFGAKMSEWDRFCVEYNSFVYPVINCPSLGLPSRYSTLEGVLSDWKIVKEMDKGK